MKKKLNTKELVIASLSIGLSQILSYIKIFEMPQGGSITAASMVPIILFSLIFGVRKGLLAATVYGFLQFLLGGSFVVHPLSFLMDYILAFGILGIAGVFKGDNNIKIILACLISCIGRFIILVLSGALLWYSYAPEGMNPWWYSITYNASYMIPETIITIVIILLIYKRIFKILKTV